MKKKSPDLTSHRTLAGYITAELRATSVWKLADRIAALARRFMLVWTIIKWTAIAFAIIETSAILIIAAVIIITLLPTAVLTLTFFAAADAYIGNRLISRGILDGPLSRESIYIIRSAGGFGKELAAELSRSGTVFVLDPDPRERYICIKREGDVYYIRHAFYFRLFRRRLKHIDGRLIYLL